MQSGYTNNSVLVLVMPTQISGIGGTTCVVVSTNLMSVTCTKSVTTIKARLVFNTLSPDQ